MTEPCYPNAKISSPGAFTGTHKSIPQIMNPTIDPRLLSLSNSESTRSGSDVAAGHTLESTLQRWTERHHTLSHRIADSTKQSSRTTRSKTRNQLKNSSLPSCGTASHIIKSYPHCRRNKPNSATILRGESSRKRRQDSPALRSRAASLTMPEESEALSNNAESDGAAETDVSSNGKIRWMNGVMEWYDEDTLNWRPARYHRDCRIELIILAAQQPGAPMWTQDMGDDYTSFSPVTQGWTEDPSSVVDSKGRQVFFMEQCPPEMKKGATYGPLIYDGCILLDQLHMPVRDIPGLPLTLSGEAPGWLLGGLRRCLILEIKDLRARSLDKRVIGSDIKKRSLDTKFAQRIRRWREPHGIRDWFERNKDRGRTPEQQAAVNHDSKGPNNVRTEYQTSAGPDLGSGSTDRDIFTHETQPSTETSLERDFSHAYTRGRAETYLSDNEYASVSSFGTIASVDSDWHAETGHLPVSTYPASGIQRTTDYSNGQEINGMRNPSEGNVLNHGNIQWGLNDDAGALAPSRRPERFRTATHSKISHFSRQCDFQDTVPPAPMAGEVGYNHQHHFRKSSALTQPLTTSLPHTTYPTNAVAEVPSHYIQNQNQPQEFTHGSHLSGEGPHYLRPRNAAEIESIQSALELTRAQYKFWTSTEPPETSVLASYAEQHQELQTHLERNWPFQGTIVAALEWLNPMSGGLDQW